MQDAVNNNRTQGPGSKPPSHLKFLKSSKMKKIHSIQDPSSHGTNQLPEGSGESHGAPTSKGNAAKIIEQYGGNSKKTDQYNYRVQEQVVWNKNTQASDKYRVVRDRSESEPSHAEKHEEDRSKRTDRKTANNSDISSNGREVQDSKHYGKSGAKHHGIENESAMQSKELKSRTDNLQEFHEGSRNRGENLSQDKLSIVIPPSKYLKSTSEKHHAVNIVLDHEQHSHDAMKRSEKTNTKSSFVSKHDGIDSKHHGKSEATHYVGSGYPTFQDDKTQESDSYQHSQNAQDINKKMSKQHNEITKSSSNFKSDQKIPTLSLDRDLPAIAGSTSRHRLILDGGKHPLSTTSETPRFGPASGDVSNGVPRELTYVVPNKDNRVATEDTWPRDEAGQMPGDEAVQRNSEEIPLPAERKSIIKVSKSKAEVDYLYYTPIAFDERVTFWLQRAWSLHCACAFAALYVYAIALYASLCANNAIYAQGSDQTP